ncbi:class I SAM-dependent methyltransferase [Rhodospirillum sp. A1_3_36]|uniref:class I SAM-dependent methyltransferase n=1 Tax=Rhodospirillum sp. A1_3_36 TaxID=3391666 RepID=UPI0039A45ECE
MPIFPHLISLYEQEGLSISSGLDTGLTQNPLSEFTYLFDDHESLTGNLGIAMKEVYFLECLLGQGYQPKRIFAVGNSFGWSSLALALAAPYSQVAVLEAGGEVFTSQWITRTNLMAKRAGLSLKVVRGLSPDDSPSVITKHLEGKVNFAFIDGNHTNDSVRADFAALQPFLDPGSAVLFHDVIAFHLQDAVRDIIASSGFKGYMLHGTPSGMAIVHGPDWPEEARAVCRYFGANKWAPILVNHFRKDQTDYTLGSDLP